jgi:AcrR family transcriptional regulator
VPTPTWDRLPAARRDAVVAAAAREFAGKGFSSGSLNVIAREAGVAKGSLFQYFEDKLDLFAHLSELASERIGAAMAKENASLPWAEDFFGSLAASMKAWVDHFQAHPDDLAMTAAVNLEPDPSTRRAVREVVNRHYVAGLRGLIDRGVASGALRPDADHDAFLALLLLVLPHLALATTLAGLDPVLGLADDPDQGVDRLVEVFRTAFGTTAGDA